MPLNIDTATARLVRDMANSELAIADALVAATTLMHSAALAQRDVRGADAGAAHAALLRMNKMATGLIEVQANSHRAHEQLLKIGYEMGATEEPTCPEVIFTSGEIKSPLAA